VAPTELYALVSPRDVAKLYVLDSSFNLLLLSAIFRALCGDPKIKLAKIIGGASGPEFGSKIFLDVLT